MDQVPRVALLVTRRPEWVAHGLESAGRVADTVVYRFHGSGAFSDVINEALREARELSPVVMKVDDHDCYPDDHADMLELWKPGWTVWGNPLRVNCDGTAMPRTQTMSLCASAFPTDITVSPDRRGQLWRSVYEQTTPRYIESGMVKRMCMGDWSWGQPPRQLACDHGTIEGVG